jgi:hypothetical protein
MSKCKHKFNFSYTDAYWKNDGRNSRIYYLANYFHCKNCLEEKIKEKRHHCFDSELWNLPDWAKTITQKVNN